MKIVIDTKKQRIRYKKYRKEPFYNEEIMRRLLVRVCAKYIKYKGSKEYVIDEFVSDIKKEVKKVNYCD